MDTSGTHNLTHNGGSQRLRNSPNSRASRQARSFTSTMSLRGGVGVQKLTSPIASLFARLLKGETLLLKEKQNRRGSLAKAWACCRTCALSS